MLIQSAKKNPSSHLKPLIYSFCGMIFFFLAPLFAQGQQVPKIGAQIWVEPGMTAQQIDQQFQTLAAHQMPVTRLFMVWQFMHDANGNWDFSLYDNCFTSAQKHKVGIVATLMPNQGPVNQGYFYKVQDGAVAKTQQQLNSQARYIQKVVNRYKTHPALDTWMLMNEPGQFPAADTLALERFRDYLRTKYANNIASLNKSWLTGFKNFESIGYSTAWATGGFTWPGAYTDWQTFWREHLSFYLNFIATEIRKEDAKTPLHVNPHALLDITSGFDFPSWRKFLNSLGSSIHPVWHFESLKREQYPFGISFVSAMVRGASEPNPYWITELQGGHNIFTGSYGLRPTPQEISNWLWTGISSGAERIIFWCLNPRLKGTEAGEWTLLDFQGQPTERMKAASEVAKIINQEAEFFKTAKPKTTDVTLILSLETMTLQERMPRKDVDQFHPRSNRAHKSEALGFYKALQSMGLEPQVKFFHDFAWEEKTKSPRTAILPHVTALSEADWRRLNTFINNGNHLVVSGATGLYDASETLQYGQNDYLEKVAGLKPLEITMPESKASRPLLGKSYLLVKPTEAKPLIDELTKTTFAYQKQANKGQLTWFLGLPGMEAYQNESSDLAKQINKMLKTNQFTKSNIANESVLVKSLANNKDEMIFLINHTEATQNIELNVPLKGAKNLIPSVAEVNVANGSVAVKANSTAILKVPR